MKASTVRTRVARGLIPSRSRCASLLLALLPVATGAEGLAAPVPDQLPAPLVPEITVTAPEPRYVAPTLRDRIGRIWAPVYINGQGPFRLVLDTGATRSAVTTPVAVSLGLLLADAPRVNLLGTTGPTEVPMIEVGPVEIGDFLLESAEILVLEDAFGGAEGVLSTLALQDRRIQIEFRRDRIEIVRSANRRAPRGYVTIPMRLDRRHIPVIDVRVGGVRARAMVDTGAQQTTGNLALQAALAARRRQGPGQPDGVLGVSGDVQQGQSHKVPPIVLGGISIRDARITFADLYIFRHWDIEDEPFVLIGMDVWGVLDTLIIDYRRKELQIRLAG